MVQGCVMKVSMSFSCMLKDTMVGEDTLKNSMERSMGSIPRSRATSLRRRPSMEGS